MHSEKNSRLISGSSRYCHIRTAYSPVELSKSSAILKNGLTLVLLTLMAATTQVAAQSKSNAITLPGTTVSGVVTTSANATGGGAPSRADAVDLAENKVITKIPKGGATEHTSVSKTTTADPNQNPNPCPDNINDPIALSSGSKYDSITDFSLPGEMGLKFERFYNSKFLGSTSPTGSWTTNIDFHLYNINCVSATGGSQPCAPVTFIRPDGSELTFPSTNVVYSNANNTPKPLTGPFTPAGTATLTYNADGSYTVHDEDSRVLHFSSSSTLLSIMDLAGVGWNLSYPDQNTTVVTHTSGQSFRIAVVSGSRTLGATMQVNVTDPAGNVYTYNSINTVGSVLLASSLGVINSVVLPGSPSTTVSYKYQPTGTSSNSLLTEIDYNGIPHDLTTYDSAGRANMASKADGSEKVSIVYSSDSIGQVATVTNALGHVSVYQYNSQGLLVSIADNASTHCAASYASNTYDANGNMASSTDNNGNITHYTYSANGLLQQIVEAAGTSIQRTTDYAWDPTAGTDRPLSITVEGLTKTAFTYNGQNRLASITVTNLTGVGSIPPLVTAYNYNLAANGMVTSMTVIRPSANNTDTITSNYNAQGFLTSIVNGLGQATSYGSYTALGQPGTVTNPNGDTTSYLYDARSRVTTITHSHAGATNMGAVSYDANSGLPSLIVQFDNEQTHNTYDADFKLMNSVYIGPAGTNLTTAYTYDADGNITNVTKTLQGSNTPAVSQSWNYDELGRVITILGNHGQQVTIGYDLNGNQVTSTDAAGHTTTTGYDALNRPIKVTDANGNSSQFVYGLANRINHVTDNRGLVSTYVYDGPGSLWTTTSPDSGTTQYSYDAFGHRTSMTPNNGITVSYNYDSIYRVTSIVAGGETHTYSYDNCTNGVGRLCGDGTPHSSASYTYTPEGWMAQQTVNSILGPSTDNYSYDGIGRLIQIANSVATIGYTWSDDQVSQVTAIVGGQTFPVASNIAYDAARHIVGWNYGNGMGRTQTYDSDGRITGIASGVTSNMQQSLGFSYDNVNRVTNLANTTYTPESQSFTYDNLDRLLSMSGPAPLTLTYDANSNRASQTDPYLEAISVDTGSNRLLTRGGHTYAYDPNGNVSSVSYALSGTNVSYTYDGFGRMSTATRSGTASICETNGTCPTYPAGTMTYMVGAEGRRESKTNPNGETAWYYHLPSGQLESELSTKNGLNYYIYLYGQPIGVIHNPITPNTNTLYYVSSDQMGRPEIITDSSQNKVWQAINFAFDRAIIINNLPGIDIGLPGQVYDQETGNWSNGFRDYDSSDGRYMESDPIGLAGGMNTYAYTGNNPLIAIDPSGLDALVIAGGHVQGSYNIFGHVANAVTGAGVYSYGNDTPLGSNVQAYIQSQSLLRNQVVTYIPTSPVRDAQMIAYYALHPGMNSVGYFDNCAARTNQALNAGNVSTQNIPFPGGLSRDAGTLPNTQQFFIPQGGSIPQALMNLLPSFEPH